MPALADAFIQNFDIDLVTSRTQLDELGRVRYRVYCEEFGYEKAESFPLQREFDSFDDYSFHSLISHRHSGLAAGCVRLICADDNLSLPLEAHCRESVHLGHLEELNRDRGEICEMSRLAVDATFRKRRGETQTRLGEIEALESIFQENRALSLVAFAAFLSAFALAELSGRPRIYAMMEPNLPRLLRRTGVNPEPAGELTEYHGSRSAYFVTLETAVEGMRDDVKRLYWAIHERLESQWERRLQVA